MPATADDFLRRLDQLRPPRAGGQAEHAPDGKTDPFAGVRMGEIFALARDLQDMRPPGIERLLEEIRARCPRRRGERDGLAGAQPEDDGR